MVSGLFGVWRRDAPTPAQPGPQLAGLAGVRVAFEGRLDNRDQLRRSLAEEHDVAPAASTAELIALLYASRGDAFATTLIGDFALAVYDERRRRLVLARDPIGVVPLYYSATPRRVVFATSVRPILAESDVRPRPNERLLAELMLGQLHRQDDDGSTFFAGVSSVPASHLAIFDANGTRVEQYWEFDGRARGAAMSFDDYAAELRAHLSTAVERRLRYSSPVAISVSGGLDSSALFCLARECGAAAAQVRAFTYTAQDGSPADESAFVKHLERIHGPIDRVPVPAFGSVLHGAREHVRWVEAPVLDMQSNRSAAFMTAVAGTGASVLMTGHWGDQMMFDQAYLVDDLRRFSWRRVRAHLGEYMRWFPDARGDEFTRRLLSDLLDHAAPRWVRPMMRRARGALRRSDMPRHAFTQRFCSAAGDDIFRRTPRDGHAASALCRALYREARSKFHAMCLETGHKHSAQYGLVRTLPFLDRDLLAFVLGVPGGVLARGGVPKALLREAVRGIVPESIRTRRTKGDFTAVVNSGVQRELADISRLLSDEPLVVQFGYVAADTMIAALRRAEHETAQAVSAVAAWRLADIVALEFWLQEFFGAAAHVEDVRHA